MGYDLVFAQANDVLYLKFIHEIAHMPSDCVDGDKERFRNCIRALTVIQLDKYAISGFGK